MDFKDLQNEIVKAQVGVARITDVKTGKVYSIVIDTIDGKDKVFLKEEGTGKRHSLTVNSLASMRIVATQEDAKKVDTTSGARDADGYSTLQAAVVAENGVKIGASTIFTVVHKLKIMDREDETTPVYKNEHYKGYQAYLKGARVAGAMEVGDDRNNRFNELGEELRKSGIKDGVKPDEKNLVMMPVFIVQ